jgi:ATP-dependent exoDNAse (exonuclease V) alpha subunit
VKSFDGDGNLVLDNNWTVSKDFGFFAHGFCVTSHKSQGKTVDRVLVGQSSISLPAASREQFYVSCSRGRESVTVYCDDKAALKEAVGQADERVTASQLIRQLNRRQIATQRDWDRDRESIRERMREELVHER